VTALYVFDFDGVLFDTERETLEVAFRSVRDRPWARRWKSADDVADAFHRDRYFVGPPWQYAVLFECIANNAIPRTHEEFAYLAAECKEPYANFTEHYFATRAALAADRDAWLALSKPYESARRFVALHAEDRAVILSTRDDNSIRLLCAHYLGVPHATLLPRSGPRPKWELLVDAARERGIAPERVFFLDDHIGHALPARQHGIAANLAAWGYLGPDDVASALTAGLPCLQLSQLDRAIHEHQEHS
jgi:FMN phosphatase YigB (HAD superfamily)